MIKELETFKRTCCGQRDHAKWCSILLSIAAYVAGFALLYPIVGAIIAALMVLPLLVVGWYWGLKIAIFAGLAMLLANNLMFWVLEESGKWPVASTQLTGWIIGMAIVAIVGRMYDLHKGMGREIYERKRAEAELREVAQKLQCIFDAIGDAIHVTDLEGNLVEVNEASLGIFGCASKETILHRNAVELIDDTDHEKLANHISQALETGHGEVHEYLMRGIDGRAFNGETHVTLLSDGSGNPTGFISVTRDITDRKRIEDELRESEAKYSTVVEMANDGLIIVQDELVIFANEAIEQNFGCQLDELIGSPYHTLIASQSQPLVIQRYKSRLNSEDSPSIYETKALTNNGEVLDVEISAAIIEYDGKPATLASIRDITARKRAEEKLRESEARFKFVVEQIPGSLWTTDADLKFTMSLGGGLQSIGLSPGQVVGMDLKEYFDSPDPDFLPIDMHRQALEGKSVSYDMIHEGIIWETYLDALRDLEGNTVGVLGIAFDITDKERAVREEARANKLEELDRLRSALLASVSHELRTPLAAIKGMADTLLQTDVQWDTETQRDYLRTINRETDTLTRIVSDLMQMSQLEAGIARMDRMPTVLSGIIVGLGEQLRAAAARHDLQMFIPRDLPRIEVDEVRIGQVITNLVSNATAYSKPGTRIMVTARAMNEEIVVSVSDEGIGIAPANLDRIFDRFHRLEAGVARRRGGTGLGLSISKAIVEEHGGRIWADSGGSDKGSTFTFTLPTALSEASNRISENGSLFETKA